jgi:hypothetical protein
VFNGVKVWVLLSSLVVASGWILSVFHQLNPVGYAIVFGLAIVACFFWQQQTRGQRKKNLRSWYHPLFRRFKCPAPLLFLALALLALVGGLLYPPFNGSSTAYRIPRVMYWLAADQWNWVRTLDVRMNIAGCGMEWFFAPLILLTHGDRLLFLPNWISFLLLPGLVFSVFTRLRISPRVAWWWMWLLPSGWCFIMQAGSTINDSFAAVYALAAVDFALRARESRRAGDVWLSLLSAALATGVKQSDVLLAIPGLIALWPSRQILFRRPIASLAIVLVCALISVVPTIYFNLEHTGNWAGVTAHEWGNAELPSPFWGVIGNVFCLTAQNLKPPVFPFSKAWNAAMQHFLQTSFGTHFRGFEDFGRLSFGVGESGAALGASVCLFVVLSFLMARSYRRTMKSPGAAQGPDLLQLILKWVPWGLLLAFMAKIGTFENGRQFASYYILLFPLLLASPGQAILVRQRWWRILAVLIIASSASLLVISRDRPLFPAQRIISLLETKHPDSKLIANIKTTYAQTPAFAAERKSLAQVLPPDEPVLGFAPGVDCPAGSTIWLPYGQRRIIEVLPDDTLEQMRSEGMHYVVVENAFFKSAQVSMQQWLDRCHAVVTTQWQIVEDPYEPPKDFYLVKLQNP